MLCLPTAGVTCSQTPSPTTPPTEQSTTIVVEPTVAHQPSLYSPPVEISSLLTCPEGFTGPRSYNDCKEFYFCMQGTPNYPTIRCRPGTLFDEVQLTCLDASDANCALLDDSLPSTSEIFPSLSPVGAANEFVDSFGSNPNETSQNDGIAYDPNDNNTISNESILGTGNVATEANDLNGNNLNDTEEGNNPVGSNHNSDDLNVDSETTAFENSGGTDSAKDGNDGDTLETSLLHNNETPTLSENILHSTIATEAASIDYENLENSHITVAIKLGSYPQDIGWSLLSFDGSINIAKPPGTYNSMKVNATVYETVSIPPQLFRDTLLLTLTISSIRGLGLSSGFYKVFSGVSDDGTLLAEGTDFEHFKAINLFISADGVVQAVGNDHSTQNNPDPATFPTLSYDGIGTDLESEIPISLAIENDEQNKQAPSTEIEDIADIDPIIVSSAALNAENKEQNQSLSSTVSQNNIADQVTYDTNISENETNVPNITSQSQTNTGLADNASATLNDGQDTIINTHGPEPSLIESQVNESMTDFNEQSIFGSSTYVMDISDQLGSEVAATGNKGPSTTLIILITFLVAAFITGMALLYRAYTKKMPILGPNALGGDYDSEEDDKALGNRIDSSNSVFEADMAAGAVTRSYDVENASRVYTQVDENNSRRLSRVGRNNCVFTSEQIFHSSQTHFSDSSQDDFVPSSSFIDNRHDQRFDRQNSTTRQNYDNYTRRSRSISPTPNGDSRSKSPIPESRVRSRSPNPSRRSRSKSPAPNRRARSKSPAKHPSANQRFAISPSKDDDYGHSGEIRAPSIFAEGSRTDRSSQSQISVTPYHNQHEMIQTIPPNDAESTTGVLSLFETRSEKGRDNGLTISKTNCSRYSYGTLV